MTSQLSPLGIQKFFDNNGLPLSFGFVYTYAAGTTTPQATYVDSTQTTQNTNPIVLNFRGECAIWLDPTKSYKFNLTDSSGNQIPGWPVDNIPGSQIIGGLPPWTPVTAIAGQTNFTGTGFTSVFSGIVVFNGIVLIPSVDFTVSSGTITLITPASAGDTLMAILL